LHITVYNAQIVHKYNCLTMSAKSCQKAQLKASQPKPHNFTYLLCLFLFKYSMLFVAMKFIVFWW